MCAQNGKPDCMCSMGGSATTGPRFTTPIVMAAPLKGAVNGGYNTPGMQPGQMMTARNGGTLALYEDLYGAPSGFEPPVQYEGTWGGIFAAGKVR
jgi:hypothetical protein